MTRLAFAILPILSVLATHAAASDAAPVAVLDAPGEALCGVPFVLSGARSAAPKEIQFYHWRQLEGPAPVFADETQRSATRQITVREPGLYIFGLDVHDGSRWSPTARAAVKVTGPPTVPVTIVGGSGDYGAGETVRLDAGLSMAPVGKRLSFTWKQIEGPAQPLSGDDDAAVREFTVTKPGRWVWEVVARTDEQRARPATVQVNAAAKADGGVNARPVAKLKAPEPAGTGRAVVLDAAASSDPDGDVLTWHWSVLQSPERVTLDDQGPRATFVPRTPGVYEFALSVADGHLRSDVEIVRVEVEGERIVAAEPEAPTPANYADPLHCRGTVELRGANLATGVALLSSTLDLTLQVDPSVVRRQSLELQPLHLSLRDMPAHRALDWVARQTDTAWVRTGEKSVLLTRGYGYLRQESTRAVAMHADGLFSRDGNGHELLDALCEAVKPALWANRDAAISVDATNGRLSAVLPAMGLSRIHSVVRELRATMARPIMPLNVVRDERERRLLDRELRLPQAQMDAGAVLDFAAQRLKVSIGYRLDDLAAGDEQTAIDWPEDPLPLRTLLALVIATTALDGYVVESPNAVWLHAGHAPLPTRQDLWQKGEVAAFDMRGLRAVGLSPELLVHAIKKRIAPASWTNPAVCLHPHGPTNRLLVIHHPDVLLSIADLLHELQQTPGLVWQEMLGGAETDDDALTTDAQQQINADPPSE